MFHSWGRAGADEFNVRTGPNYRKTGKKIPSQPSFYEIVAFDFVKADVV